MVAAALLLGSGTAVAAPGSAVPVASAVSSDGGTGGEACAHLPVSLQELMCPSAERQPSGNAGGAGSGATSSGTAATGGTAATTPPSGTSGAGAPATPPGVVSNFLIWLAGLFQYFGL